MNNKEKFAEDCGHFFETFGLTRMSGRVLGHLLISKEPLSIGDLVEKIDTSKSAISNALKELRNWNLTQYASVKSRREYIECQPDLGKNLVSHYANHLKDFSSITDTAPKTSQLKKLENLFLLLNAGLPRVIDLWESKSAET